MNSKKNQKMILKTFENLEKCYNQAEIRASKFPPLKDPFYIGELEEFNNDEIINPPHHVKIWVSFRKVYAISFANLPHSYMSQMITTLLIDKSIEIFGRFKMLAVTQDKQLLLCNLLECGTKFGKYPDSGLETFAHLKKSRKFPSLVIEIGHIGQDMDQLLRIAEVYLNATTDIEYVLLINIVSNLNRISEIRFVICRRINESIFNSEVDENLESEPIVCKTKISKNKTGRRLSEAKLKEANSETIEKNYQLIVVFDETISAGGIRDVTLEFEVNRLLNGTLLNSQDFSENFSIIIDSFFLNLFFQLRPN